jgi:hypothetical protein
LYFTEPDSLISAIVNIISLVNSVFARLKGRGIRKVLLVTGFWFVVAVTISFGQTNYYSKSAGNLNTLGTWGQNIDGSGTAPTNFTNANQIFNIRNNVAPTISSNWTVSGSGSRVIIGDGTNACVFTVSAALVFTATTNISNHATLRISSTAATAYSGTLTVEYGGTYEHAKNGGTIPTAIWDPSSNCNITGVTNTTPTGFGQTFGNLTWNCPNSTGQRYLESNITIAGNFSVLNTGTPIDPNNQSLRMSNTASGYTITVYGDVDIDNQATFKMNNDAGSCYMNVAGNFTLNSGNFTIVTGPSNSTLSVAGNVNIFGGTLNMQEDASSTIGTFNIGHNLTLSGSGSITESMAGKGVVIFNGNTTQVYSRTGGTISNTRFHC